MNKKSIMQIILPCVKHRQESTFCYFLKQNFAIQVFYQLLSLHKYLNLVQFNCGLIRVKRPLKIYFQLTTTIKYKPPQCLIIIQNSRYNTYNWIIHVFFAMFNI
jgi:hypothetical protein